MNAAVKTFSYFQLTTQALETTIKKLARLSSGRTFLESLKTTLCNMKDDSATCKENLLTEITSADHELYYAAYYSLQRTKLTVAVTHAEELSRLKKLRRDLANLNRRRADLLHATNDEEMNAAALKEAELSAKKLLECVKKLQQTAVLCEDFSFDKLKLAPNFASIQLHFKDLSLVTSDSVNVRKQLARLPIEAQTSKPIKQGHVSDSDEEDDECSHSQDDEPVVDASPDQLTIRVDGLQSAVSESELTTYFSQFGSVEKVRVARDSSTGDSHGFGFVTFADDKAFKRGVLKVCHFLGRSCLHVLPSADSVQSRGTGVARATKSEKSMDWDVNPKILFVSNFPEATEECDLYEYFSKFGIVTAVTVHKKTRKSRGLRCGFVTFRDTDAARRVLESRPHVLHETEIAVSFARLSKSDDTGPRMRIGMSEEGASTSTPNTRTIYVGWLTPNTTEADLVAYFTKFGNVTNTEIKTDKFTKESRGFGFVTFEDNKAFENGVMEACHLLNGCRINVKPAKPYTHHTH
nr:unnamed protein product [Spirometra erinaceieuropaei]